MEGELRGKDVIYYFVESVAFSHAVGVWSLEKIAICEIFLAAVRQSGGVGRLVPGRTKALSTSDNWNVH
jgi:hypothetical protein